MCTPTARVPTAALCSAAAELPAVPLLQQRLRAPPDELVSDVAECFHVEGVLVLNYCLTPAWG